MRSEHTCDCRVLAEQCLRNALDLSNDLVIKKILYEHSLVHSTLTLRNYLQAFIHAAIHASTYLSAITYFCLYSHIFHLLQFLSVKMNKKVLKCTLSNL